MVNQDPICNPPFLDSTLFPVGTAALDPNFKILPFLCQLMSVATNENVDPVLAVPPPYDISKHLNFSALTAVGDIRWSTGAILSAGFVKFLPRIITQIEVKQAGGSQIIDNYICDSDGNPIRQSLTVPAMTTVGTGGINLFGYDIPSGLNYNDLLKPLTSDEVIQYVNDFVKDQSYYHADAFITYLTRHYNPNAGWAYSLGGFNNPPFFYVKLNKIENKNTTYTVYLKYYSDVQEYVAKKLSEIGFIDGPKINITVTAQFDDNAMVRAYLNPIPDYLKMLTDEDLANVNNLSAMNLFKTTDSEKYSTLNNLVQAGTIPLNTFNLVVNS